MTREECEMLILQHVKEIKDIAKQYDTSKKVLFEYVLYK